MAENIYTSTFGAMSVHNVCTTTAELDFDKYMECGIYNIHEDTGNGCNRVYALVVGMNGSKVTQTRTYNGGVAYRERNGVQWSAWKEAQAGGGDPICEDVTEVTYTSATYNTVLNGLTSPGIYKMVADEAESWVDTIFVVVVGSNTGGMGGFQTQTVFEVGRQRSRFAYSGMWSGWWNNYGIPVISIELSDYVGYYEPEQSAIDTPATSATKGNTMIVIPNRTFDGTNPSLNIMGNTSPIRIPSILNPSAPIEHPTAGWFTAGTPIQLVYDGSCWVAVDYAGAEEISSVIGDINSVLDAINGEVI